MTPSDIQPGKVFIDTDGIDRYVISVTPASGKKLPRVIWRHPGQYAKKIETETLTQFIMSVVREGNAATVDRAPHLPNDGMASI